jgi:CRISPR/Cas system type I-B associated protein Csh2 (Cas7 group RAMP superfamily)
MGISIEDLGITKQEMQDRVVNQLCNEITGRHDDESEYSYFSESSIKTKMREYLQEIVDKKTREVIDEKVLANFEKYLQELIIKPSSRWGEKEEAPVSIEDYIEKTISLTMAETVDSTGRGREDRSYSYYGSHSTRLEYLINRKISAEIETSFKSVLVDVKASLQSHIEAQIKNKLTETKISFNVSGYVS